jgi:hypothetical protein
VSRPGRALPPGKGPPAPIGYEAGCAPEPVWTQRLEEKFSDSVGDRIPVVQSVVSHYTDFYIYIYIYIYIYTLFIPLSI